MPKTEIENIVGTIDLEWLKEQRGLLFRVLDEADTQKDMDLAEGLINLCDAIIDHMEGY